jgi:hypothetical protein
MAYWSASGDQLSQMISDISERANVCKWVSDAGQLSRSEAGRQVREGELALFVKP